MPFFFSFFLKLEKNLHIGDIWDHRTDHNKIYVQQKINGAVQIFQWILVTVVVVVVVVVRILDLSL